MRTYTLQRMLPRFDEGTPYELYQNAAMDYIKTVENASKVGFKNGIWRTPNMPGYDKYQIGHGLDIREENNPYVYNYLKKTGRLNNPYLTEKEEEDLRRLTYQNKLGRINKIADSYGSGLSELGYARIAGMVWHGDPGVKMMNPKTVTGKAFKEGIISKDDNLDSTFNAYYTYPANKKLYTDRYNKDLKWALSWKDNSALINSLKYNAFEPVLIRPQLEINTDYSINNPAPTSISSWSGAGSPAYGGYNVRMPSILLYSNKSMDEIKQLIAPTL